MTTPWNKLPKAQRDLLLYGTGGATYTSIISGGEQEFEGVITNLKRRVAESESDFVKEEVTQRFMREVECPVCAGKRLKPEALSVKINGKNIYEISSMQVSAAKEFFARLQLTNKEKIIAKDVLKEINARLNFLNSVGLSYLTLNRKSQTLSGGEAQRIHLATQIGSGLTGVL